MRIYEDQFLWTGYIKYIVDNTDYIKAVAINTNANSLQEELNDICAYYIKYFKDERGLDVEVTSSICNDLTVKNGSIVKRRKPYKYEPAV